MWYASELGPGRPRWDGWGLFFRLMILGLLETARRRALHQGPSDPFPRLLPIAETHVAPAPRGKRKDGKTDSRRRALRACAGSRRGRRGRPVLQEPVLGAADGERWDRPDVLGVLSEVPETSMSVAPEFAFQLLKCPKRSIPQTPDWRSYDRGFGPKMQSGEGRTAARSANWAPVVPCGGCTAVAEWLGPSSLCALRPRQDCFGGRHPNTNAKTTIATSMAKMTTWMMSPLVMVDRVAANERDPGREVLNRGLHRPPRPPGQTTPELSPAVMAKLG